MNYFFNNPQTQKPMSDEELMTLALQNKEKARDQRKKKEMKSCGCCPVDPYEDAQRRFVEHGLRKDFDFRNNWYHSVLLFLSSKKRSEVLLQPKAGLVKWYNGSFVMISWGFDSLIQHHNQPKANACFLVSSFRLVHPRPNVSKLFSVHYYSVDDISHLVLLN